ncbi:ImmA/IrrE family metallo-endopeptidase [Actinomadura sp. NAK00032]|uniref:ImmA/IrrE family metallo-endopeptidase n=1 Tax=Actinomadura sp. NAK00032 TaxID=2742128 RepID=UPI001C376247|nr:XRE family transcriptional regulator [Actinomadura sp. NAK00032]
MEVADETLTAQPGMLVLARESRGLTQTEVARAMARISGERVSQAWVSKAEAGRTPLSGLRLAWYAAAVGYPPQVLCEDPQVSGVGIGLVHHRKKAALGATALRRIHAELALARRQVGGLLAEVGGPVRQRFVRIGVSALDTPMDAAQQVRELWDVPSGPVEDMVALIERAGGLVLMRDLRTADLDAVSQWDGDQPPLVLANAMASGDRLRFSLGHEIGHLIMHAQPAATALQEREADQFASELLMPASDIRDELGGRLDLDRLLALKQRWGVSMAALARRAQALAVISDWQYRNLMIEMSTLGYRTKEPGAIPNESPRTLHTLARLLVDQYSAQEAAAAAGLLPDEFITLYLPEDSPVADPTQPAGHSGVHAFDSSLAQLNFGTGRKA